MKSNLILGTMLLLMSCQTHPNTFVLEDTGKDKFYLSDSIKKAIRKGQIGKSPLIAIDGLEFKYQTTLDTITLPLKKNEIIEIVIIHKTTSQIIYGEAADNGAVVINTHDLKPSTADTVRSKD